MIDFHPDSDPCPRCEAVAWECIGTSEPPRGWPQDILECAFCGVLKRVRAVRKLAGPRQEPPRDEIEFRFESGRFVGMTLAEADAQPNGRRYLETLLKADERLRGRIEEYLKICS